MRAAAARSADMDGDKSVDLILRNARLLDGQIVDIGVEDGSVVKLEADLESSAEEELDAAGGLTLPACLSTGSFTPARYSGGASWPRYPSTCKRFPVLKPRDTSKRPILPTTCSDA